jgi:hypothetical protein
VKYLLSFVFLCNISFCLHSQSIISGKVTGGDDEAIVFAPVTLKQVSDSSIVAYTTTDGNGNYKLTTDKKGSFFVQVNYLGYASQIKHVNILEDKHISDFDFIMIEDIKSLQEVVIKGRRTGVVFENDTIRYDPKVFKDGTEVVLGDLLNKLPGIEVDDKGSIKAHGKQVNKLLLNGQDFFQGNTQMATKNLSADIAESVEVLNNYSEYSLLSGFQSHEKTAINVGVNKEKFGKISGNLSAGYGVENKYRAKGDLMLIKPKTMISIIGSANNTGDQTFSIEDYIRLQGGVTEFIGNNSTQNTISLSKEEQNLLIPNNNVYERNSGLAGINLAYQPKTSTKIDAYILYNGDRENSEEYNTHTYLLPEQKQFTTFNHLNGKDNNRLFSGFVKVKYQPYNSLNVIYKSLFSNTGMTDNTSVLNRLYEQQVSAYGYTNTKPIGTKQNLAVMKSFGKHLLISELSFSFDNKPFSYSMQSDSLLLPLSFIRYNDDYYYGRQNTEINDIKGNIGFAFFYKIGANYFLRAGLGSSITKQTYLSEIYQTNPGETEIMLPDANTGNDCSIRMNDYNASLNLTKNKGFFQFKLGISSHLYGFNTGGIENVNSRDVVKFNPEMEISLHFSDKHVLSLSGNESDILNPAEAFASGVIFDSYRHYSHNGNVTKLYSSAYNMNLSYSIFNTFSNTMVILIAGYSKTKNSHTVNYYNDGLLTESIPILSIPTERYHSRLNVNKGLGFIPWTLKLTGGYIEYSFYNQSANKDNKIKSQNTMGDFSIVTNYRQVFNLECRAGVELVNNSSSLSSIKTQTIQRYAGKLKFDFSKRFGANTELEYVANQSLNMNLYEWYLSASIHYKINKKTEINLSGTNMLNLKSHDWVSVSYNGIYVAERNLRRIPGNILLRLNYFI